MQLLLLGLAAAIFIHDAMPGAPEPARWPWLLTVALLPKAGVMGLYFLACRWTRRTLARAPARSLQRLDRFGSLFHVATLTLYLVDLYMGLLLAIRLKLGDFVLLDELLVLLPPLAMIVLAWASYYPIDRRLREASLLRRLDQGLPPPPIWSRSEFVLMHLRHEVALILLPLLLILSWYELSPAIASRLLPGGAGEQDVSLLVLRLGGALVIFGLAPLIIRYLWNTRPMPPGDLRDMLLDLCRRHRVRVREVLLWRTAGGVANAAVMGFVPSVRYILLTDVLVENMPRPQLEAVMAHELAHVKRRHMFWLAAVALASIALVESLVSLTLTRAMGHPDAAAAAWWQRPESVILLSTLIAAAAWISIFGYVSRRAERQADAFAVQHLAAQQEVDHQAAETMVSALQQVAMLNNMPITRHNWRHGSIAWRQHYLRSLVGQPVNRLPIDRLMNHIKFATVAAVAATAAIHLWLLP